MQSCHCVDFYKPGTSTLRVAWVRWKQCTPNHRSLCISVCLLACPSSHPFLYTVPTYIPTYLPTYLSKKLHISEVLGNHNSQNLNYC